MFWQILGYIGIVVSIIFNIILFIFQIRQFKRKKDLANDEIFNQLMPGIYDEMIPPLELVVTIMQNVSAKFKTNITKLIKPSIFYKRIIGKIWENPALSTAKKQALTELVNKEIRIIEPKPSLSPIIIERSSIKHLQKPPVSSKTDAVFSDNFEVFTGWKDYKNGKISQSNEYSHSGKFSLKKDQHGDFHGGWKDIGRNIGFGKEIKAIVFSGWLYRPSVPTTNFGDRLAIEDSNFSGYGFCINHLQSTVLIERRDMGKPTNISIPVPYTPIADDWVNFEFYMRIDGKHNLVLNDGRGGIAVDIKSFIDSRYLSFNRISIHGGFPFYLDDIKLEIVT